MMTSGALLLIAIAMLLLLSKHWVRVTDRDREEKRARKLKSHLDWKTPRRRRQAPRRRSWI